MSINKEKLSNIEDTIFSKMEEKGLSTEYSNEYAFNDDVKWIIVLSP